MEFKENENLTPAQNEAYKKAYDLLAEHFDGLIIGICVDDIQDEGENKELTDFTWKGGFCRCYGMAHMIAAKFQLKV
jgi:hypothetical protein